MAEDEALVGPVTPFNYRPISARPDLVGVLEVILHAKRTGSPWADCALAEISGITGINYVFMATVKFDRLSFEIGIDQ